MMTNHSCAYHGKIYLAQILLINRIALAFHVKCILNNFMTAETVISPILMVLANVRFSSGL